MGEVTTGIRSLLSLPRVYDAVQAAFGAESMRAEMVGRYIRPQAGTTILDIGSGTSEILNHLPSDVHYWGFDRSPEYVQSARARYGGRGRFECGDVAQYMSTDALPSADVVIAIGVLHHLDWEAAESLIDVAWRALRRGGRLVTVDPTVAQGQSRTAAWLVGRDRGQNVLTPDGYRSLALGRFPAPQTEVRHDLLRIPYSHCVMQCVR